MTEYKNVHEAISGVMSKVGYVQKDGKIKAGKGYTYASEAALINAIRGAMVEAGLYMYPDGSLICPIDINTYETSSGSTQNLVTIQKRYLMVHAPSQTEIEIIVFGQGADVGDKAVSKAMTNAYKYAIRQTFMLETGDDPDHTASDTQERASIPWNEVMKQIPSPNMTKVEKDAWKRVVKERVDAGVPLNAAMVTADEAYYEYIEKKENK